MCESSLKLSFFLVISLLFVIGTRLHSQVTPADQVPPPAGAVSDPVVTLAPKAAISFGAALQSLAAQGHISVVAEDAPLHEQLPATARLMLPPNTRLSEAMKWVGRAFDYDVQRNGSLFLLRKRFTDPNDLPDVTPEECAEALKDIAADLDALSLGPPDLVPGPNSPLLMRLAASLTPNQLSAMRETTPEKGLAVASLTEDQQALVRRFVLTNYVYDPDERVHSALDVMNRSSTLTLRFDLDEPKDNGATGVRLNRPQSTLTPKTMTLGFVFLGRQGRPIYNPLQNDLPLSTVPDPAALSSVSPQYDSKAGPALQEPPIRSNYLGHTTLAAVVTRLNGRGLSASVDAMLGAKFVTIYGADATVPEGVLKALADVYRLHIITEHPASGVHLRLTRPSFLRPLDVTGLPEDVRYAMPAPLLRAMHDGELEEQNQRLREIGRTVPKSSAEATALAQEQQTIWRQETQYRSLPTTLRSVAAEAVRFALEERLETARTSAREQLERSPSTAPVALASLPAPARSAFAVALMTDVLTDLVHTLGQKAPVWVADLDDCYLTGGLGPSADNPGKPYFTMFVSAFGGDGRLVPYTGTGTGLGL